MSQYVLILFWMGLIALAGKMPINLQSELNENYTCQKNTVLFSLAAILPVVLMAGTRSLFGDTTAYKIAYESMPFSVSGIGEYMADVHKDRGFYFFSALLKATFAKNTTIYFLLIALIQGVILVLFFRRYSPNLAFSLFLFIASSDYISWMYNGIRQFLAVVIILLSTQWMLKKKYILVIVTVLFASLFHQSALLMIPFALVAQGDVWNKKTIILIGFTIVALAFVDRLTDGLDQILAGTQYTNIVNDFRESGDNGTNPIRVLVYSIPAVISFVFRKRIKEEDSPIVNLCTNMSIISMLLYIVSMLTSGVFLGRLPIYASLYSYILLPWEIDNLFSGRTSSLVRIICVIGYLGFYYYQMRFAWNMI